MRCTRWGYLLPNQSLLILVFKEFPAALNPICPVSLLPSLVIYNISRLWFFSSTFLSPFFPPVSPNVVFPKVSF